ncbi:hypothetical protein MNBD_GAMMA03-619 [hydrothermal vent metagenome]|uniref:Uncharacterized protein n=1 Tax=hydrothermal vent metagenome TaxID=652676 RepID=A0A3B0VZS7_9ZZZZ
MYQVTCKLPVALGEGLLGILALSIIIFSKTLEPMPMGFLVVLSINGLTNAITTFSFLYLFSKNSHQAPQKIAINIYDGIRWVTMITSIIVGVSFMNLE